MKIAPSRAGTMTDAEFLSAFESCELAPEAWTHQAHVRMAWLYLARLPLSEARTAVRQGIQRYNCTRLEKPTAYHETITQGFLTLIFARMQQPHESGASLCCGRSETFAEFCARNEDLLDRQLGALLMYYRRETLSSAAARESFVRPDLRELPTALEPPATPPTC